MNISNTFNLQSMRWSDDDAFLFTFISDTDVGEAKIEIPVQLNYEQTLADIEDAAYNQLSNFLDELSGE